MTSKPEQPEQERREKAKAALKAALADAVTFVAERYDPRKKVVRHDIHICSAGEARRLVDGLLDAGWSVSAGGVELDPDLQEECREARRSADGMAETYEYLKRKAPGALSPGFREKREADIANEEGEAARLESQLGAAKDAFFARLRIVAPKVLEVPDGQGWEGP